ncbi:hypothetical protein Busp01_20190 [Trinickia caryophylli]|nr:hypothetical protein Busp01_20190 [Trinickia caryophylli]
MLAYHERTKHRFERYAAGPETLDWDAQPAPFRRFAGAPVTSLPLPADTDTTRWDSLFTPGAVARRPACVDSIGLLFELSFALSAWKRSGPDRWALRCNPSSGNLHPTEVYLLAHGVVDLDDGLYHYAPQAHALERRAAPSAPRACPPSARTRLIVGFSSIHWREAWKYGERAFRYCQLDIGHALGALRYAAAVLGWRIREVAPGHHAISACLGLDRAGDFGDAEREEPEALFELLHDDAGPSYDDDPLAWMSSAAWHGRANRLDAHPMYRWPVIDAVAHASRRTAPNVAVAQLPPAGGRRRLPDTNARASTLIRARRSAQHFDRRARLDAKRFWPIVEALLPGTDAGPAPVPWDIACSPARVHPVLFAHRVDGLEPGAYLLLRDPSTRTALQAAFASLPLEPVHAAPPDLPLYCLAVNPALAGTLRTLSCHQAIGADAMFVVALVGAYRPHVDREPHQYRALLREAGHIGQVLYMEAEAAGLRGTGIGCYFDDPVHALLGLDASPEPGWQVLYHFSVGLPLADPRIVSEPPYGPAREERPQ